jgi:hypothetical protein
MRMYKPHSILTKEMVKMAKAKVIQIKISGGYCDIKNADRRAIAIKNIRSRCVRTVFV